MGVDIFSINIIVKNETSSEPNSATSTENMRNNEISKISEISADQRNQCGLVNSVRNCEANVDQRNQCETANSMRISEISAKQRNQF